MLNGTVRVPVPAVDTSQCAFARFAAEGDSPHTIHNYEEWAAYSAVYSIRKKGEGEYDRDNNVSACHALF